MPMVTKLHPVKYINPKAAAGWFLPIGLPWWLSRKKSACHCRRRGFDPWATHSSVLAWETPWMEKPGGLQSMRLQKAGHDLATKQQHTDNHAPDYYHIEHSGVL